MKIKEASKWNVINEKVEKVFKECWNDVKIVQFYRVL